METRHESVFLTESMDALDVSGTDVVVDATIGGAGHFSQLLSRLSEGGTLIGIDADADAIERASAVEPKSGVRVDLIHDNFRNLDKILLGKGIETIDKALFDLGWSSFHLTGGRGFSFKQTEPLLMTYGEPETGNTAADLVNSSTEEELSHIFYTYGEERYARKIARAIVEARRKTPIYTTDDLVSVVKAGTPDWYHHRKIHPATKVFQALRIAVNDELGAAREGIGSALSRLRDGGRIAVITFHSIEDRLVKTLFRQWADDGHGVLVTRKPLVPSLEEIARNPRARSAKLRVAQAGVSTHSLISHSSFALV